MSKSPDEIKKGLECCIESTCEPCCPYGNASYCKFAIHLLEDAIGYIRQLEAERDAAVPVVRCKDCVNRGTSYNCPMRKLVMPVEGPGSYEDCTEDMGFCHMGKRREAAQ